jgi:tetratricopeptide (TPR) repeat protein
MMVGVTGRVAAGRDAHRLARCALAVVIVAAALAPASARADERAAARAHYDKAAGAYALGRYAEAAAEFEESFTLKPDPALLFNAAQAYRLAGDRERALQLYHSYLRVYGHRAEHAPDAEWHIAELEKVGVPERRPPPPVAHASLSAGDGAARPPAAAVTAQQLAAPPPAASASLSGDAAISPGERDRGRPIYRRWWFWAGAGAVVVGAVVTGIVLASHRSADCGGGVDYCASTGL